MVWQPGHFSYQEEGHITQSELLRAFDGKARYGARSYRADTLPYAVQYEAVVL